CASATVARCSATTRRTSVTRARGAASRSREHAQAPRQNASSRAARYFGATEQLERRRSVARYAGFERHVGSKGASTAERDDPCCCARGSSQEDLPSQQLTRAAAARVPLHKLQASGAQESDADQRSARHSRGFVACDEWP